MYRPYYLLTAFILLIVTLSSCSHPAPKSLVFKPDILPPFYTEIDITHDTTLRAPEGSLIHIPAHSLDAGGATRVRLMIREALHMSDIVRAGLFTSTNGDPLSSGGMIDIEAAEGQTVTITKALSVSIPAFFLDSDMELYKGVKGPDGNLNWKNPGPLSDSISKSQQDRRRQLGRGKVLFMTNCASCHAVNRQITGPDLAYIYQRRDKKWLFAFTHDNQRVLRSGDRYANCLYNEYNRTAMNIFPNLTDSDLDDLYRFIDYDSYQRGLPFPDDHLKHCADSCDAYEKASGVLQSRRRVLIADNGPLVQDMSPAPVTVSSPINPSEYYQFTINTFGWYNADKLLYPKGDAVQSCVIKASIRQEYKSRVNLYIIVPSKRIFQEGGPLDIDSVFGFDADNGEFPLPYGVHCLILALGEKDGAPLIGYSEFLSGEKPVIGLDIRTATKEEINEYFRKLDLQDVNMQLTDSKNATDTL